MPTCSSSFRASIIIVPAKAQEVPGSEQQGPNDGHPECVWQHQRDYSPDTGLLVVDLGKSDNHGEVGVERGDRIDRRNADPVGGQDGRGIAVELHEHRNKDRREDCPFGDRRREHEVQNQNHDDKAHQQPERADIRALQCVCHRQGHEGWNIAVVEIVHDRLRADSWADCALAGENTAGAGAPKAERLPARTDVALPCQNDRQN
jgi:hypothetical protein